MQIWSAVGGKVGETSVFVFRFGSVAATFKEMNLVLTLDQLHLQLYPPIKKSYNVRLTVIHSCTGMPSLLCTNQEIAAYSSSALFQIIYYDSLKTIQQVSYRLFNPYISFKEVSVKTFLFFILWYWSTFKSSCHVTEWLPSYFGNLGFLFTLLLYWLMRELAVEVTPMARQSLSFCWQAK